MAGPVDPDPRVGAVFLDGDALHVCTASVLHSKAGDLVLTAAHCLAAGSQATFVPGFAGAAAPSNTWTVDEAYFDTRWIAGKDPRADYAIARVSGGAGGSVERQAGSALSLGRAPASGTRITVTGYPAGVGGRPISCQGSTGMTTESGFPSLACEGLVDGTSGAPWISGTTVTGVIGGFEGGGCAQNLSYTAPFDEHTAQLLARAEAGGPGDAAPSDFSDSC
jgi:V8-like Glu-specific endopeptidase